MVNLVHKTRSKAYLVAIAAVSASGSSNNLTLRQLAWQGFIQRFGGVGSTSDAHCLIDVGTPRKRVADTASKAGGGTTERLNLGRVVVRLVLEVDEPLFLYPINGDRHYYRASIDLITGFLVVEVAHLLQAFACQGSNIHQAYEFVIASDILLLVVSQILPESTFDERTVETVVEMDVLQLGGKSGMAAMIAPIGVQHTYFGHRRVAMFLIVEITLYMLKVSECHCKAETVV